jgi:hypothetical protein
LLCKNERPVLCINRVNRFGDFSPIGRLFTLGSNLKHQ